MDENAAALFSEEDLRNILLILNDGGSVRGVAAAILAADDGTGCEHSMEIMSTR